ncbi:MAG: polysaccharide deacetylase family protein [Thermodesulfovibrionales bacterium]|nr:polysaccharide deacetylase family protein [Thermodesulfovibrionales bacterium]
MRFSITRRNFLKLSGSLLAAPLFSDFLYFKKEIPVLLYHDISKDFHDDYTISPALFSAQMEWLYSAGYVSLTFRDVESFLEGDERKGIIITFDDGYASLMDYAFPLLKEYNFKATVNIIGVYVGSYINLGGNRPVLSWDEYRYLLQSGLVDLGCHTYNLHFKRGMQSLNEEEFKRDLLIFQDIFYSETGKKTDIFAWPYGLYNERALPLLKEAGFKYILTSEEGFLKGKNFHKVPRLNINNKIDLFSFKEYIGYITGRSSMLNKRRYT